MSQSPRVSIQQCFSTLTDPRRRKIVYPLVNVVTIAICAVPCGADDFVAIAQFGRTSASGCRSFWISPQAFPPMIDSMRSWELSRWMSFRSVCWH